MHGTTILEVKLPQRVKTKKVKFSVYAGQDCLHSWLGSIEVYNDLLKEECTCMPKSNLTVIGNAIA